MLALTCALHTLCILKRSPTVGVNHRSHNPHTLFAVFDADSLLCRYAEILSQTEFQCQKHAGDVSIALTYRHSAW